MDLFWLVVCGFGLLTFLDIVVPRNGEKKGSITAISYGILPFEHTTFAFATYSQDVRLLTVEGKHIDFTTGTGVCYTIKHKHIPFHWYSTLESAE